MNHEKILITGTLGFIGTALCNEFYNAIGIDEIYDQEKIYDILYGYNPNVVFHVGACTDTQNTDFEYMLDRNYLATKWISAWCRLNKRLLIYSSSAACYGINNKNPSTVYGWSKYFGEKEVINNGGIALRYFNVYGPGESHKAKMASFIYQHYNEDKIGIFKGNPSRDFIYISDVVSANLYALENYYSLQGKYYDVGTTKSTTYEELCNIMGKKYYYLDSKEVPKGYQYYTSAEPAKLMNGWKPLIDIKTGINNYLQILNLNNEV